MSDWLLRDVPLKFGIGDRVLMVRHLPLQVHGVQLGELLEPVDAPPPPPVEPVPGSQGFFWRALPVAGVWPRLSRTGGWLCYVTLQYEHSYIDLSCGIDAYRAKFSSKTRSTINRKLRKFQEHCDGRLDWKVYDRPDQMAEYHRLAREVSTRTYQEQLLDAGIPEGAVYLDEMTLLARQGLVRGYLLFHNDRPVAYLHCPISGDAYVYAYLGYDPDYMHFSVGTVLQWLAMDDLFGRPAARFFDFTEGQSGHKRLFATHARRCANVMQVRATWGNRAWLYLHAATQNLSSGLGRLAERWGLKPRLRRLLRFGVGGKGAA